VRPAPGNVSVDTDAGDLDVTVPRGEYAVSTHTDVGDVSVDGIVRYDRAAHSIDASTDVGDITIDTR
jgi:hypothetical protein